MRAKFRLVGLECANCAAKMEKDINKINGVTSAEVNHMTEKMIIEAEDSKMDEIITAAEKIVKKHEHNVVMKRV